MTRQLAYYYRNRDAVRKRQREYDKRIGRNRGIYKMRTILRICEGCGCTFERRYRDQTFHSGECRRAAWLRECAAAAQQAAASQEQPVRGAQYRYLNRTGVR